MKNRPAVIMPSCSPFTVPHLCLRLDARSRKKLVDAMVKGIVKDMKLGGDHLMDQVAEAALSALEKMAEGK